MYKGKPIENVITENPKYVSWAVKNVSFFGLSEEEHALLSTKLKEVAIEEQRRMENLQFAGCEDDDPFGDNYDPFNDLSRDIEDCFRGSYFDF